MKGKVIKSEEQPLDKWRAPELYRLGGKNSNEMADN